MGRQRSSFEWLSTDATLAPPTVPYTRERGLWLSVLWQALQDYFKDSRPLERNRAHQWIIDRRCHIGSFNWICEVIGVCPESLRKALMEDFVGFKTRFLNVKGGHRD